MRLAESDDVWADPQQDAMASALQSALGVPVTVAVVGTEIDVVIVGPGGTYTWRLKSGDQWRVDCPSHGTSCGTPFTSFSAAIVDANIVSWWSTHA